LAIRFECPECGKTLSVQDQLAGKKVKCPCGAVVVANAAGPAAAVAPKRPAPSPSQTKAAPGAKPASSAGPTTSRPTAPAPARPSVPAARGPAPKSDLADLFDELTPTDLETRAQRSEAAAGAPAKVDPLAAYRPATKGRSGSGSSGPTVERPLGLKILAGLAVLGIIGSLGGAAVAFFSPDTLQRGPEPIPANIIKLTGGLLIGSSIIWMILVSALLTPQPWAWWFCNLVYSSNIWFNLLNSFAEDNIPRAIGRATGGLLVGAIVLSYFAKQNTRNFFGIKLAAWVGPVASVPAGLAIAFALIFGIGAAYLAIAG